MDRNPSNYFNANWLGIQQTASSLSIFFFHSSTEEEKLLRLVPRLIEYVNFAETIQKDPWGINEETMEVYTFYCDILYLLYEPL